MLIFGRGFNMKLAIMQPYIFPYIGYFQLMHSVDKMVVYDNVKYTKKGWINRNRILMNGEEKFFTLPLKNDSDYLDIVERKLADNYMFEKPKILRKIYEAYRMAPYFDVVFPIVQDCINYSEFNNLFDFIFYSIIKLKNFLDINTKIIISSSLGGGNELLKGKDRVIELCLILNADHYINPIGGLDLYDKLEFQKKGITLNFLNSGDIKYRQFSNCFYPNLSIIDVLMFNNKEEAFKHLCNYSLI